VVKVQTLKECVKKVSTALFVCVGEWIWGDEFKGIWVDCMRMKRLFGLKN